MTRRKCDPVDPDDPTRFQRWCTSLAVILINTYRAKVPLFIDGKRLFSSQGTTQGDPLAMAMYAISVVPLIDAIRDCEIRQAWLLTMLLLVAL